MNIGIDIDGVLNDLQQFNLNCGLEFCYKHHLMYAPNPEKYYVRDMFGWSKYYYRLFQHEYYKRFFLQTTYARPSASEVIRALKKDNNIYIITARKNILVRRMGLNKLSTVNLFTKTWLQEAGIEYDHLIFTSVDKQDILYHNRIDVMIEDSPLFFEKFECDQQTQAICFDAPYNRGIRNSEQVLRAHNWLEIFQLIKYIERRVTKQ